MENWIIFGFMGGIFGFLVVGILIVAIKNRGKSRGPRRSNSREMAEHLGLTYEQGPIKIGHTSHFGLGKQWDIIQWRISGAEGGREFKLESKCTRTRGIQDYEIPSILLETPCHTPPDFNLFVARTKEKEIYMEKGYQKIEFQLFEKPEVKILGRLKGEMDTSLIQSLDVIGLLASAYEHKPAYIEATDGRAIMCVEFGDEKNLLNADIVKRSIKALIEFAEKVEH